MKKYTRVFIFTLLVALGSGCASDSESRAGFNERLSEQRSALTRLETKTEHAERAQSELSEIDTLLRRVEAGLAQEDPGERVDLTLTTAEARISRIQALYAEWAEEERLENARGTYEATAKEIERIRKENEEVFEGGDQ